MTYPHFIQVTNGVLEALVNIDQIKFVCPHPAFLANAEIHFADRTDQPMITEESYEDVEKLIRDSGSSITRPDPRIDTQHRLTMQDLQEMIGEPVWNSNTNTWLLVYDGDWGYGPDPDRVCVRVVNRYGCKDIWLSEEDLIAKPLYRMKAG